MADEGLCTTIETYNANAQAYIQRTAVLEMGAHLDKFRAYLRGNTLLSVGCGYGKDESVLAERGMNITGIDLSEKLLAEARQRVPKGTFLEMNMRSLGFKNDAFDGVYCCASLHHLQRTDASVAVKEMQRVLAPTGVLYICVKEGLGEDWRLLGSGKVRETFFSRDEFANILENAALKVVEFYPTGNRITPEAKPWLNYFCRK